MTVASPTVPANWIPVTRDVFLEITEHYNWNIRKYPYGTWYSYPTNLEKIGFLETDKGWLNPSFYKG